MEFQLAQVRDNRMILLKIQKGFEFTLELKYYLTIKLWIYMLTKMEIRGLISFDVPALLEGIRQVELALTDARETKSSPDKKTFSLLTIYIAFATLCLGLMTDYFIHLAPHLIYSLWGPGISFTLGSVLLLISLWNGDYGSLGRYPRTWLTKELIEGRDRAYGYTLAIILYEYEERIILSDTQNMRRAKLVNLSIFFGILAPISLLIISLL